jgi:hypothetical protein
MSGDAPADALLVGQLLNTLSQLQVTEFVKDVVTDFKPFGLDPAQRHYTLRMAVTNATGPTNIVLAAVEFGTNALKAEVGTNAMERVFARRLDEESVYAFGPRDLNYWRLPGAAWQLRDHRVWNFATNQVAKIAVTSGTEVREVVRQPDGRWIGGQGFNPEVNSFAFEELAFRLGELSAMSWLARGEAARTRYGFSAGGPKLTVELRTEKPQTLTLELMPTPERLPYIALATINGEAMVFEFPWMLYLELQRYFNLPGPSRK